MHLWNDSFSCNSLPRRRSSLVARGLFIIFKVSKKIKRKLSDVLTVQHRRALLVIISIVSTWLCGQGLRVRVCVCVCIGVHGFRFLYLRKHGSWQNMGGYGSPESAPTPVIPQRRSLMIYWYHYKSREKGKAKLRQELASTWEHSHKYNVKPV